MKYCPFDIRSTHEQPLVAGLNYQNLTDSIILNISLDRSKVGKYWSEAGVVCWITEHFYWLCRNGCLSNAILLTGHHKILLSWTAVAILPNSLVGIFSSALSIPEHNMNQQLLSKGSCGRCDPEEVVFVGQSWYQVKWSQRCSWPMKTFCAQSIRVVNSTIASQPQEQFVSNRFLFVLGRAWLQVQPIKQVGAELHLS